MVLILIGIAEITITLHSHLRMLVPVSSLSPTLAIIKFKKVGQFGGQNLPSVFLFSVISYFLWILGSILN